MQQQTAQFAAYAGLAQGQMGAAAHVLQLQESSAAQQIQAERQAGAERLALLDRLHQAEREGLRYREQ
eukprot:11559886-Karenia_brevis.AAC.1